ncbi:MAG: ASPIC/UnbV domain-containing protein [Planctomycetota bacterium]
MTSQSPASGSDPTDAYADAWASIAHLVAVEGMSWSGRERNRMFLSVGNNKFVDASSVADLDFLEDARALAQLDWDGDGRVDLLLRNRNAPRLRLLRNRGPEQAHWMQVQLVGTGKSNRDAIGARVTLKTAKGEEQRNLRAGEGFLSQNSKTLFFGLGDTEVVDSVAVRWPDGTVEEFPLGTINSRIRLTQGKAEVESIDVVRPGRLAAMPQEAPTSPDLGRVTVITKLPMEEFPIPSWENPERKVKDLAGRPLLINFWSTTCASCIEEFEQIRLKRKNLNRRGLQVVTLLTDGPEAEVKARTILKAVQLDRMGGRATETHTEAMRFLIEEILGRSIDMPLPVSLLLDERGQLVQIHIGALKMQGLIRDLGILDKMDPKNPSASPLAFGRRLAFADRSFNRLAGRFQVAGMHHLALYFAKFQDRFQQPKAQH